MLATIQTPKQLRTSCESCKNRLALTPKGPQHPERAEKGKRKTLRSHWKPLAWLFPGISGSGISPAGSIYPARQDLIALCHKLPTATQDNAKGVATEIHAPPSLQDKTLLCASFNRQPGAPKPHLGVSINLAFGLVLSHLQVFGAGPGNRIWDIAEIGRSCH